MDKQIEHVLRVIEEQDIRSVRLWFPDVLGTLKSVAIAPTELDVAFSEGIGFDGSSIEGITRVVESDMLVTPDASTFVVLPWASGAGHTAGWQGATSGGASARMFGELHAPDGEPSMTDSRYVLKRALSAANDLGYTFFTHPEIEFYLFRQDMQDGVPPTPVDQAGYFDNVPSGVGQGFRRNVIAVLEAMGIAVEYSHHENGPGQNEIDLRSADALTTADNIMTFRTVVKEAAVEHGMYASFMPKPLADHPGSAMHTHLSLFDGDSNVFFEAGAPYQLSQTARRFIAGVLRHASETCLITNQYVNSYKRLWGGGEAPSYICWGHNNRSALVRVPMYKPHKGRSTRIEHRGLDSAANPYLAFAVILAAGLKGITEEYELPEEAQEDVWSLTDAERRAMGIAELPTSLDRAISAMEESELVATTLGEHVFDYVLRNKRQEWAEYRNQVTPFELRRYLPLL